MTDALGPQERVPGTARRIGVRPRGRRLQAWRIPAHGASTTAQFGGERIGDAQGPGWVRTVEDGERTLAQLTDSGRAVAVSLLQPDDGAPA